MHTSPLRSSPPGDLRSRLQDNQRSRLLPDLNGFLLAHSDLRKSFPQISSLLHRSLAHQHADLTLYEPESNRLRIYAQYHSSGTGLPETLTLPLTGTPYGEAVLSRNPVLVDDLRAPQFACAATEQLLKYGRRSGCFAPLCNANNVLGALSICSGRPGAYRQDDARLLNEAAGQISLALANELARRQLQQLRELVADQIHDWNRCFREVASAAAYGIVQWGAGGVFSDANDAVLNMVHRTRRDIQSGLNCSDIIASGDSRGLRAHAEQELCDHGSFKPFLQDYERPDGSHVSALISPGVLNQRCPPWLVLAAEIGAAQASTGTDLPDDRYGPLSSTAETLAANSPAMRKVLREIEQVAATATTVLLQGETGTGKEMLAHLICEMSPRRHQPFIKINCAAIPAGLLESELFGHEKGAFTGAYNRKIGRIELAHRGTLFLDEVGDLPPELQPKLLRVLQDHQFERLGGTQTIRADVRLIGATNRNLAEMVAANQFRRDLFYRLNVFPVHVPALRERPESIALLANNFAQRVARRLNRSVLAIPPGTMIALERWSWPGNIRELENLIERGVILSPGPDLLLSLDEIRPVLLPTIVTKGLTLSEIEREHILRILHETKGVVGGKNGAASILGVKRSTLQYRMKKLNISPH